jgi:hypothetical protein
VQLASTVSALVFLVGCTATETRPWIVSSPRAGANTVTCEVLRGGCDVPAADAVHRTTFCAASEAGAPPTALVDGETYGYRCTALDCCGAELAAGCTEIRHPPAATVRVVLDEPIGPGACSRCTAPCERPPEDGGRDGSPHPLDADALDGRLEDAIVIDPDAPSDCGGCAPGSVCVDALLSTPPVPSGSRRCAVTCTAGSACPFDEECKWYPEGRACGPLGAGAPGATCTTHASCGQEQVCVGSPGSADGFCARASCASSAECDAAVCGQLGAGYFCVRECPPACEAPLTCAAVPVIDGLSTPVCALH